MDRVHLEPGVELGRVNLLVGRDPNRAHGPTLSPAADAAVTDALRTALYRFDLPAVEMMNLDKRTREKDGHGRT